MENRGARLLGHPIHQIMIVFPLGLLATAVGFDIAYLATNNGSWAFVSYCLIAVGVVSGAIASIFGLIDWVAIPDNTRAKAVGTWHGIGNAVVLALFGVSWYLRFNRADHPEMTAVILAMAGVGLALVTGWLGGELVDRLGIGPDRGAHPNAPSSLSDLPATAQAPNWGRDLHGRSRG